MPTAYKVLGQSAPSATTDTTLYTVPAATETIISTLTVCNRSATQVNIRIAIRPDGATLANSHYIAYDVPLNGNSIQAFTLGLTLNASDVITVRASTADTTFNAYGSEIS